MRVLVLNILCITDDQNMELGDGERAFEESVEEELLGERLEST
jgi:hypothetical protein